MDIRVTQGEIPSLQILFTPNSTLFSFKPKIEHENSIGNSNFNHLTVNFYRHSNNFNSAHTNFKINAVMRHKDIKQQSVEILGGICINSSDGDNENDIFELDYTYTKSQSNPNVTSLIDIEYPYKPFIEPVILPFYINDDGGVYNSYDSAFDDGSSPHLVIRFTVYYNNENISANIFPLINGIITLI